jgi:hypothetical protein
VERKKSTKQILRLLCATGVLHALRLRHDFGRLRPIQVCEAYCNADPDGRVCVWHRLVFLWVSTLLSQPHCLRLCRNFTSVLGKLASTAALLHVPPCSEP